MATSTNPGSGLSRYEQVKSILETASIGSSAIYEGYDRFWNLPLPQLLTLELYGIRMIAPVGKGSGGSSYGSSSAGSAPPAAGGCPKMAAAAAAATATKSCCHANASSAATVGSGAAPASPGRGAASGLIKGLKGQFPFDGSQFPRLPWGGQVVSGGDIAFISQWIDDGCPATDDAPVAGDGRRAARANGDADHPGYDGSSNDYHDDAGSLKQRKNVKFLTPQELARYRSAVAQMMSLDAYFQDNRSFAYWARIHATSCQHGWEEFLTWHRAYLYFFEKQLQDIDPGVTIPYWDWAADSENVKISLEDMAATTTPLDNGIIPDAFCCWVDADAIDKLRSTGLVSAANLAKLSAIEGKLYCSGNRLFLGAGISYGSDSSDSNNASTDAIMNQLAATNPLWHRQRWPGGQAGLIFEEYPTPEDVDNIMKLDNFFQFGSGPSDNHFFGGLEQQHNLIHNFSGGINPVYDPNAPASRNNVANGDMVNAGVTAFDPIFWSHHSNVDRLWAQWQSLHPGVTPDDPTSVLPPWPMTVQQTYNTATLGYEYVKGSTVYPTDNSAAITSFKSSNTDVHPDVIDSHRRAEIRLHKVQYPARVGYHIRVFLNQPDASVSTKGKGNPNYVGMLHMFSGNCIGGPGHCDVPPETRPRFDQRGRAHKAPVNFRLDATATVKALAAQGALDFHVNLVVLNTDGSAATDALILDAVSLNFFD